MTETGVTETGAAAADLVGAYVATQVEIIAECQEPVLADAPDAVHRTRVATRRLRSALRTFSPLWRARHRGLLDELRWFAGLLGGPRDLEVMEEWLLELSATIETDGVEALQARLKNRVESEREEAFADVHKALGGKRFGRLVRSLTDLTERSGWQPVARVRADLLLPGLAAGPTVMVDDLRGSLPEGDDRLDALHELRKKAKAARYGYEAIGSGGQPLAKTWKRVTEALGAVQDGAVAIDLVGELRSDAVDEGEDPRAYDALLSAIHEAMAESEVAGLAAVEEALAEGGQGAAGERD